MVTYRSYPDPFTHSQTRVPHSDVGLGVRLSLVHAAAVCLCSVGMWDNTPSRRVDPPAEEIQVWLQAQALRQAVLRGGHPPNVTRGGMLFFKFSLSSWFVLIAHFFHECVWQCSVPFPPEQHIWPLRFSQPLWWSDRRSLYRTNQIVWDRGVVPLQRRHRGEGEEAQFSTCSPIPQILTQLNARHEFGHLLWCHFQFYRSENRYLGLETSLWCLAPLTSSCTGGVRSQMCTISFFLG